MQRLAETTPRLANSTSKRGDCNPTCAGKLASILAPMRVAVVGAGGIGGLYGGLLARAGHTVAFLARGKHLDAIRQRGLEVRSADFGTFVVHAHASDDPADLGQADLVLFAVETYD